MKTLRLFLIAAALAAAALPAGAAEAPLAIHGYDPVAYFTLGRPARGLAQFEYTWDELRFRFATAEHRELFKAAPARYAPQFRGTCAMALTRGELEDVDPRSWLISEGKLYLFGKSAGPALFQRDLGSNITRANDNRWMIEK